MDDLVPLNQQQGDDNNGTCVFREYDDDDEGSFFFSSIRYVFQDRTVAVPTRIYIRRLSVIETFPYVSLERAVTYELYQQTASVPTKEIIMNSNEDRILFFTRRCWYW